jgi:hypothetical protein
MGTKKDFRVKTGLVVEDGDVTLASAHSVKAGTFDTNIAAAGVTLTGTTLAADGTDNNININLTPKGTGEVNITKVDINAGTIDGATIATSDVTVGSGKTLNVSAGTLTLANNQISGNAVEGGTIAATTITALTTAGITASANIDIGGYNFRAASITADGLTSGRVPFASTAGLLTDDGDFTFATDTLTVTKLGAYEQAGAVDFSGEAMTNVDINSGAIDGTPIGAGTASTGAFSTLAASGAVTVGSAGSGADVTFHSATSGDHMLWDASEEQLKIIGTASSVALDVDTGDFTVGAYGLTNAGAATIASMAGNWTNAGRTVADAGILTTVDINGGSIDGAIIGAASAAAGTFAALVGTSLDLSDGGITNVGDISLDTITSDGTNITIKPNDDQADAFSIIDGGGSLFMKVDTTNSAPLITFDEDVVITGTTPKLTIGDNGAEDTLLIFDGAEINYRLGIDDSANQFEIGLGDAHDTTPVIVMDNAGNIIQLGQDSTPSSGEVLAYDGSKWTATASASGADGMGSGFVLEDGDGTEVTIDEDKEVKFIDGDGLEINWTDTSPGSDGDPYDLTFSLDIDGMTDISAGLASGDLFIVDDGAGGTNRKTTVDRIATLFAGTGITASSGVINVDAAQTAATSSMTSSTSRTITTPLLSIESTTASKPVVQIKNTANDQTGAELRFAITFYSDDAGETNQPFGKIQTKTTAATANSETGEIGFSVATSASGALAEVMVITGGIAAASSTVDIKGHLVVRGTTTTINSTTIDVADININLGNGIGDDSLVDGGGITLESTDSNKTFNWVDSTDAWTSNQHIGLLAGKSFKITDGSSNVQSVLSVSALGASVLASSLTSVGTLSSLDVDYIRINGTTIGHTSDSDIMTLGSASLTLANNVDFNVAKAGGLQIAGTAVTSTAAELNYNDTGSAVGTVVASKTLTVDSSRDVATIRNLTSDGTVKGATLSVDAVAILDTARGSADDLQTGTAATLILMSIPKATYRAAKIMYHIKKDNSVDTDAGEMLITYNGTNAFLTHYAEISTGAVVGTWDATVDGDDIDVIFTPAVSGAHTYSIVATQLIT